MTPQQFSEAKDAARRQGYTGDICYSDYQNTSFHGSIEGDPFHYLVIGTDAYPTEKNNGTPNELISVNACMAHEVVGHYETWLKGTDKQDIALDEAQASIRASKFGVGLTDEEREILYQDGMKRLENAGIKFEDVESILDIKER